MHYRSSLALVLILACSEGAEPRECAFPEEGCACTATLPVACHEQVDRSADGLLCRSGVRYCEDGVWSECRNGATYRLEDVAGASAELIESEQACYDCNPGCRQVTSEPEGSDGTGTAGAPGGGITLSAPRPTTSCSLDSDGDRVPDIADECSDRAGRPELFGCGSGDASVFAILPNDRRRFSVAADLRVERHRVDVRADVLGAFPDVLVSTRAIEVVSGSCRGKSARAFDTCDAGSVVRFQLTLENDGVIAQSATAAVYDHEIATVEDGRVVPSASLRVLVPALSCVTSGAVGMNAEGVILPPGIDGACGDLIDADGDRTPDIIDECPIQVGAPNDAGCESGAERVTAILPFRESIDDVFLGTTLTDDASSVSLEVSRDFGFVQGWTTAPVSSGYCTRSGADHFEGCDAGTSVGFLLDLAGSVVPSDEPQILTFEADIVRESRSRRRRRVQRDTVEVVVVVPPIGCDAMGAFGTDGLGRFDGIPAAPGRSDACAAMGDRDADGISDVADDCPDLAGEPHLRGCATGTAGAISYLPPSFPVETTVSYTFPTHRAIFDQLTYRVIGDPDPAFDTSAMVDEVEARVVAGHCRSRSATGFARCTRGTTLELRLRLLNSSIPAWASPRVFDLAIETERRDHRRSSSVLEEIPVRVVVPPTACSFAGGYSSDGSGEAGDAYLDVVPAHCPPSGCACNNGLDDDGDGKIDGDDPECTSPLDDDESTFATGIPGDNRDPFWQDCFFDGNSGGGDDGCRYHTECRTGERPATHPSCAVSDSCRSFCEPLAPNGCDCFGCCAVRRDDGTTAHVVLDASCSVDALDDPTRCTSCVPRTDCGNECGRCELCTGKTLADLPADCGGVPACVGGTACTSDAACDAGEICTLGCCSTSGSVCAALDFEATPVSPNFVIVMDQSGSMGRRWADGLSRWDGMKDALFDAREGVITTLQDDVRFAMRTYRRSGGGGCDRVLTGDSTLALMARDSLSFFVDGQSPGGGTPTADAIEQTTRWLVEERMAGRLPEGPTAIILATDGEPNGCSGSENYGRSAVVDRVAEAFVAGFPTFVVGIDRDVAASHLQDVANAGAGVDSGAEYFTVTSTDELRASLTDLVTSRFTCALDMAGSIDLSRGECGGGSLSLDGVAVPCGSADGWVAVDDSQVELRGSWCDAFLATRDPDLSATFPCPLPADPCDGVICSDGMVCELGVCGCPPSTYLVDGVCVAVEPPSGTFTAVYEAADLCMIPPERPRWAGFMWEASIPSGSRLEIGVRSANTLSDLASARFSSQTIARHATSPGVTCPPREGIAPSYCGIDVAQLLEAVGQPHGLYLELRVTLVAASSDPATYPTVYTIRQEVFCEPME